MKRLFFIFSSLVVLSLSGGCSLNDDGPNFHFVPLKIVSADVPESFELNQTYRITVIYEVPNGCTNFSHFEVPKSDTTERSVIVFGIERTDQETCAQVVQEEQASFNFVCLYDQTYIFRFWQGESADGQQQYLEIEVPVSN